MKNNDYLKSVKLYLTGASKSCVLTGLIFTLIPIAFALFQKSTAIFFEYFGIFIIIGDIDQKIISCKFYNSSSRGKQLFTSVPVFTTLSMIIISSIFLFTVYGFVFGLEITKNFIFITSFLSALSLISIIILRKTNVFLFSIVFLFSLIFLQRIMDDIIVSLDFLSKISFSASVLTYILLMAAGTLISLKILERIWKKNERVKIEKAPLVYWQKNEV